MLIRRAYDRLVLLAVGVAFVWPVAQLAAQEALPPMPPSSLATADLGAGVGAQGPQDGEAQQDEPQQPDPPSVVARISVMQGNVSLQPASVSEFSPADVNYPMTTGDRLWTDTGASAELEMGQLAVRLGAQTDFTVTGLTDQLMQFGLAQGSVHLRAFAFDPNVTVELDTPNAALTLLAAGDVRVDVYPDSDVTVFTLLSGRAEVDAEGFQQVLQPGESLQLAGANPVAAHDVQRVPADALDAFSDQRDEAFQQAEASEGAYVNAGTIGADDLSSYGDWDNSTSDFGVVWYPRVAIDWQPYRYGHWAWIAPWGWTWVEREPWGFAPFHYGRWVHSGNRWGWVPGPRIVRPVYSPALVVFVGGAGFSVGGTVGVTAWFPLGPREPFVPWYHTSVLYENRVNVSNIYSRNTMEVHRVYNERGEQVYGPEMDASRAYANRGIATVAVPQSAFAAGKPVQQTALRVTPGQLAEAPIVAHPQVTPERAIVAPTTAKALPPQVKRPVLETRAEQPRGEPSRESNGQAAPVVRTAPVYRAPVAQPGSARPGAVTGNRPAGAVDEPNVVRGMQQAQPAQPPAGTVTEPNPGRTLERAPEAGAPVSHAPEPAERLLVNRVVPPPSRPSFEEQQRAIQSTEPGRPLSPQQMESVRQNQPVAPQRPVVVRTTPAPPRPAPPPAKDDKKR